LTPDIIKAVDAGKTEFNNKEEKQGYSYVNSYPFD
jgi:hypothetical protein